MRRSSARARRPAAKIREAEDEAMMPAAGVSAIGAMGALDGKEKVSPRKRRTGGAVGGMKRKRKEVDNGDATYPAKRTQNARGTGSAVTEDGTPPSESVVMAAVEVERNAEGAGSETQEDKKTERRSTRSRGELKRRDSSGSSTGSVSASMGSVVVGKGK